MVIRKAAKTSDNQSRVVVGKLGARGKAAQEANEGVEVVDTRLVVIKTHRLSDFHLFSVADDPFDSASTPVHDKMEEKQKAITRS